MNPIFVLFASLMLRCSAPSTSAHQPAFFADREMATPAGDSLHIAAAFHVAGVSDAFCLNAAQIQQLKRLTNEQLQQVRQLKNSTAGATAEAMAGIAASYQQHLVQMLSPGQYTTLLSLNYTLPTLLPRNSLSEARN